MSNSKIIVAAGIVGIGIGMLIAPKKGKDLQKSILDTIDELGEEAIDFKEHVLGIANNLKDKALNIKETVEEKVERVNEGIDDVKTTTSHLKAIFS